MSMKKNTTYEHIQWKYILVHLTATVIGLIHIDRGNLFMSHFITAFLCNSLFCAVDFSVHYFTKSYKKMWPLLKSFQTNNTTK